MGKAVSVVCTAGKDSDTRGSRNKEIPGRRSLGAVMPELEDIDIDILMLGKHLLLDFDRSISHHQHFRVADSELIYS